jgi:hypothetical protein
MIPQRREPILAFYVGWPSAVSAITRVREAFAAKPG